jgi:hypothetical protein
MRDKNGRFVKGNKARSVHKQKVLKSKAVLNEMEELQAKIYNESLKQILDKLETGELNASELIRINSGVAEMVTPKADKKPMRKSAKKALGNIDEIKQLLGED